MIIKVQRSGGFAGITENLGTVDTDELNKKSARKVESTVQRLDFFNLPATISGGIGADMMHYEVTVTNPGEEYTVTFDDDGSPEAAPLRQLVDLVAELQ
ncbi:MAG TPA: protealysin inhibitor emfourin [Chloroflexia bacterium]|nr:protealysin inhibitor emfourin [Chloroflexia bacterium]